MHRVLLSFVIILGFTSLKGQTNVSGGIFNNTTWTKANSPYIITGDMAVFPQKTLTIEPGVTVKVNDDIKFIIRGQLIAKGQVNDSIVFKSNSNFPTRSKWKGFRIENGLGGRVEVEYFKGSHAEYFFETTANSTGEVLNMSHSELSENKFGIWGTDFSSFSMEITNSYFYDHERAITFCQNALIDSCIFEKGEEGIHSGGVYPISVSNSDFLDFTESTTRTSGTYTNCRFYNNTTGLKLWPSMNIIDCEIYNNTNGIVLFYPLDPIGFVINNTCLYSNSQYHVVHMYNYNVDFSGIKWKETDSAAIATKIYDAYDDVNLGIVDFSANHQCSSLSLKPSYPDNFELNIYPNPFSQKAQIETILYNKNLSLSLYNLDGQRVRHLTKLSGQSFTLDRSNLASGTYILYLRDELDNTQVAKVFITD